VLHAAASILVVLAVLVVFACEAAAPRSFKASIIIVAVALAAVLVVAVLH
jgi:hypothetical protein